MKIASVATLELATRQLKNLQKKNRGKFNSFNFLRSVGFLSCRVASSRGGYTKFEKSHHRREKKIARETAV